MPTVPGRIGARARKYSSSKITCCMKLAPRPPYSFGQDDADPAGRVHLLLPGAAAFQRLAIGRDALVLRILDLEVVGQVGVEPGAELAAEGGVFRSVGEIHFVLLLLLAG